MSIIGFVVFAALGILQFLAGIDGLHRWLGWSETVCWIVVGLLVLMRIPLIPTLLGMYGAYYVWHWSALWTIGLFFGLQILSIALMGLFGFAGFWMDRRS